MTHFFDTEIAIHYGLTPAIVFNEIGRMCYHSRTNGVNFHDGKYWTFNSVKAFGVQFPYLGKKQIANAIDTLVKTGLILKENFNATKFDRTQWYALTDYGETIFQNESINLPETGKE